jgi:hypothetical protein
LPKASDNYFNRYTPLPLNQMKTQLYITLFITIILTSCSPSSEKSHNERAKSIVKNWISINAEYPKTYKPLEFKKIELVNVYTNDTIYRVTHNYQLKDRSGKTGEFVHFFVTKNDSISIITKKENSFTEATPPSTFFWSKKFGEKFQKVTQGNLSRNIKLSRLYKDYKLIGGEKYSYFSYLDSDCFNFLIQSINNRDSTTIVLKRIIQAYAKIGHPLITRGNSKPIEEFQNLIVYSIGGSKEEIVSKLSSNKSEKIIEILDLNQVFEINETYLNSNCFKNRLGF